MLMGDTKNARPTVAAVEQAQAGKAASNFQCDSTPLTTGNQGRISDFLSRGRGNSVSLTQIQQWTGLDKRIIRQRIAAERFKGVPILADNKTGYYLPATEEERKRCVRSMRHRAMEIFKAAQAIEAADISRGISTHRQPAVAVEEQTAVEGWF